MTTETLEQRTARIVRQEVLCCMSHVVAELAGGHGRSFMDRGKTSLLDLCEQAFELASPVPDYEDAATQAGWNDETSCVDAALYCRDNDIEPYEREVFEHWAVSDWLADKLTEQGEKVDKDFANLCVWARTTTGQGIASDYVIEKIVRALEN